MLPRVLRLPGKALAVLFGVLLLQHAACLSAGREDWFRHDEWQQNLIWFGASVAVVLAGRLLLSLLPPGATGAHDIVGLPETWAASLVLGWIAVAWAAFEFLFLWLELAPRWLLYGLPIAGLVLLAAARILTLPGAMVPRHPVRFEPLWPGRGTFYLYLSLWSLTTFFSRAFVGALAWVALAILLERGLARARRAEPGRLLLCAGVAVLGNPSGVEKVFAPLFSELGVAAALGAGAAFLVPWLRHSDKRAGVLSGLLLSSAGLAGLDLLAVVGPLVFVLASHPRQRRFAVKVAGSATLACASIQVLGWMIDRPGLWTPPRGRVLFAWELVDRALDRGTWGLAWPLVALALVLGALSFRWRDEPWTPGTIEEPRREVRALCALLVLSMVALALPTSPWFEGEVLVILFPLAALLAGLLLLPAERSAEPRPVSPVDRPETLTV